MLYQIVHTHTNENCPGRSLEKANEFDAWWEKAKTAPGVRILAGYVSPMDHTFYITVEADDYAAVAKAFGMLNSLGSGRTSPILTLDQSIPFVKEGVFMARE